MSKENSATVWLSRESKKELDEIKVIPEETYDRVVRRLLHFFKESKTNEKECYIGKSKEGNQ